MRLHTANFLTGDGMIPNQKLWWSRYGHLATEKLPRLMRVGLLFPRELLADRQPGQRVMVPLHMMQTLVCYETGSFAGFSRRWVWLGSSVVVPAQGRERQLLCVHDDDHRWVDACRGPQVSCQVGAETWLEGTLLSPRHGDVFVRRSGDAVDICVGLHNSHGYRLPIIVARIKEQQLSRVVVCDRAVANVQGQMLVGRVNTGDPLLCVTDGQPLAIVRAGFDKRQRPRMLPGGRLAKRLWEPAIETLQQLDRLIKVADRLQLSDTPVQLFSAVSAEAAALDSAVVGEVEDAQDLLRLVNQAAQTGPLPMRSRISGVIERVTHHAGKGRYWVHFAGGKRFSCPDFVSLSVSGGEMVGRNSEVGYWLAKGRQLPAMSLNRQDRQHLWADLAFMESLVVAGYPQHKGPAYSTGDAPPEAEEIYSLLPPAWVSPEYVLQDNEGRPITYVVFDAAQYDDELRGIALPSIPYQDAARRQLAGVQLNCLRPYDRKRLRAAVTRHSDYGKQLSR